jgi:hypothetical protein
MCVKKTVSRIAFARNLLTDLIQFDESKVTWCKAVLLGLGTLLVSSNASAQVAVPNPSFNLIGHIEEFSLDAPGDTLSSAKIRVRGIQVILPRNLLITMPGQYLTAQDIFRGPNVGATPVPSVASHSGLALLDPTPPRVPFEAEIVGNISEGKYIAGIVRINQGGLHIGSGYIQAIDSTTGELWVGNRIVGAPNPGAVKDTTSARVRLNDPTGVYGWANSEGAKSAIPLDRRFSLDPDNSPVHARTGFPVCIPRSVSDAKCPSINRPADATLRRYTCGQVGQTDALPVLGCDPSRPIPLRVGDYISYMGMLVADPNPTAGFIVSAHGLEAELGVYTSPGEPIVYVFIEEALQTTRVKIVGFSTDPTRAVEVRLVDTGLDEVGTSLTGPAGLTPSNGPQFGRFRNTWPAKDSARAVRRDARVTVVGLNNPQKLANGLTPGRYTAPISEYIAPEITRFGIRGFPVPVPFENFCYLAGVGGSFATATSIETLQKLDPFPNSGHPLSQTVGVGPQLACQ